MAHKDQQQPPTFFTDPAMTLLEVKMKLRTALSVVSRFFVPPSSHRTKHSGGPSPTPSHTGSPIPPSGNKLKKRHQHYHLIRRSTHVQGLGLGWGGMEPANDSADHIRQWNDPIPIRAGKTRQIDIDDLADVDQYARRRRQEEEGPWKTQIAELERWAMELEMRMEEVNRHTAGVVEATQEIMRGTMEMMEGTAKIRAAAVELLRRADEMEEREVEFEMGLENMVRGAEEMMKGAELMEKKADLLKRSPDSLQEGTSTMLRGGVSLQYKSPASSLTGHSGIYAG